MVLGRPAGSFLFFTVPETFPILSGVPLEQFFPVKFTLLQPEFATFLRPFVGLLARVKRKGSATTCSGVCVDSLIGISAICR